MALDEAALIADVRSRLFAASSAGDRDGRILGVELEAIPVIASSRAPAPISAATGPSLVNCVRRAGRSGEWAEKPSEPGAPEWSLRDGSRISFEPGGQLEISSCPHETCSGLIESLQATMRALAGAASQDGIELLSVGVDPYNDISAVPLQLHSERYARMTRYFEARGESGTRMMRQTAALQMSVEHGARPLARWKFLNALAPYLVALFANSRRYAGKPTGHASYRAHLWRTLDSTRTGIPYDEGDPAEAYTRFALDAGAIRAGGDGSDFQSFRSLLDRADTSIQDWVFHLSTLFPEVRPKEYFELRSADTIAPDHIAAPLVFIAGLLYDPQSEEQAGKFLGTPDPKLLELAGAVGLGNAEIRKGASELVRIALAGASSLGDSYLKRSHREEAARWLAGRLEAA
jgi:glutamate--cysteine ligase